MRAREEVANHLKLRPGDAQSQTISLSAARLAKIVFERFLQALQLQSLQAPPESDKSRRYSLTRAKRETLIAIVKNEVLLEI